VESGIVHCLLTGEPIAEGVKVANKQFASLAALTGDPRKEKEAAAVPEMVAMGVKELEGYGKPSSTQGKIEYRVEGLLVPMIGFYDLEWEDHGVLTDIKTTHALPSKISTNHARQVALYVAARGDNLDARVTYVTPKKSATYAIENKREHVRSLERIALTIQRFLGISDDPKELASLVVPDVDSYLFADPVSRQQTYEIWGL
jgi:hypothetical protein